MGQKQATCGPCFAQRIWKYRTAPAKLITEAVCANSFLCQHTSGSQRGCTSFGGVSVAQSDLCRRTCSPGDSTPQRQCAWLLSTYLKEGEEQKEVLEAKGDEDKESEVDGEVEERVTQRAHETWR